MRTIFLLSFALVLAFFAHSQTTIENPKIGMSTAQNVTLEKIELRDTATVLWFHVNYTPGYWINIPKGTFIQPVGTNEKLFIVSADGIVVNEKYTMPASGEVDYKLIFPKIDAASTKIDFGEEGGTWFIYDIQLKPELFQSILPDKLSGNWFRADNAQWEISLFDSVAVYKSQVWKYQQYSAKDGTGKIGLKNGKKTLYIYTKQIDDNTCMIGEASGKLVKYTSKPNPSTIVASTETFKLPIMKLDTAIYSGYIKGYSPRCGIKTGMLYLNNAIEGDQNSYTIQIGENGFFTLKVPMANPQMVFIPKLSSSPEVFLDPGKSLFQLIDIGSNGMSSLFMGDNARINSDLSKLSKIYSFDYQKMQEKILDFTPEEYKTWCLDGLKKDMDSLNKVLANFVISSKALQVKKIMLEQRYASNIMRYSMNFESAYRKKNKIPQTQRELPIERPKLDSKYYSFLTDDMVNNPLGMLTSEYYFFLNQLMYLDILRGDSKNYSTLDFLKELKKSGEKMTEQEIELLQKMTEIESPEYEAKMKEFSKVYGKQAADFNKKYAEQLVEFRKDKKDSIVTSDSMEKYLVGMNVEFTKEELGFLNAQKELEKDPMSLKTATFYKEYGKQVSKFHTDRKEFISEMFQNKRAQDRNEKLQMKLGIQPGFATDLMKAQDFCRSVVSEMTPVTDEKLKAFQEKIKDPFIANYLAVKNNSTKATIEANKSLKGAKVNEVPKTEADKVFDAIMEKYKGKVVYVDFWATWCAPCRSGIERIKPLKDELANENVAFVYITNQTSPKATYDNMIPTIKGEHYRVSADEWNILSGMFKISGIPHYTLVGKDGKVINPHLSHMENPQLKTLLMKHIQE